MSIQAVAWVLGQPAEDLPGMARLVLIAVANHADHTDGHCWPSIGTIAKEAGCSERTASRYVYALQRNGFVDVHRGNRKGGQFQGNNYWMVFERKPGPWQYFGKGPEEPPDDPPQDSVSAGQDVHDESTSGHIVSAGPADTGVLRHIMLEPSDSEPSEFPVDSQRGANPNASDGYPLEPADKPKAAFEATKPAGFDPKRRSEQIAKLKAAEDARKAQLVWVHEGTRAWQAWQKSRPRGYPAVDAVINGKSCRGFWLPSLFPPSTGPPS